MSLSGIIHHSQKQVVKDNLGSVVEWLGRQTWNPDAPGSSPILTINWSCFSVALGSTPRLRL